MNIKRLLLGLTLLTAVFTGCEKTEEADPLIVTPVGPKASFKFSGGTTYEGRPGFTEYLYSNNPVVQFENTSTRANSYVWNFGDGKINQDSASTEMNPSHQYTKPGQYVVTLTATLEENGTTQTSSVSQIVNITHPRKKLAGRYSMTDTLSKVNSLADSMTVATGTTASRAVSKTYDLTISVNSSDSVMVDINNLGNVIKTKKAALIDNSATGQGFRFTIPDFVIDTTQSITNIVGVILKPTDKVIGSNLQLKYKIKNTKTNKEITYHGVGKRN